MEEAEPAHEPSTNWKQPPDKRIPFAYVDDAVVEVMLSTDACTPFVNVEVPEPVILMSPEPTIVPPTPRIPPGEVVPIPTAPAPEGVVVAVDTVNIGVKEVEVAMLHAFTMLFTTVDVAAFWYEKVRAVAVVDEYVMTLASMYSLPATDKYVEGVDVPIPKNELVVSVVK